MKKLLKITGFTLCACGILLTSFFLYYILLTADYRLDESRLKHVENAYCFFDDQNNKLANISDHVGVVCFAELRDDTKNAFIAVEDKRFFQHNGIDYKGLGRALLHNLKSFSLKEGASTISQQLIKNTHLTNEKTIKRKLIEWKLTRALEKKYDKDSILEMYLNTIYFGANAYGIAEASNVYFGKSASELTLEESAALAGMIKAPSIYSPFLHPQKCIERRNVVLNCMAEQGYISDSKCKEAQKTDLFLDRTENKNNYLTFATADLEEIFSDHLFLLSNAKIYTYFNQTLQCEIEEILSQNEASDDEKGIVIDNKTHGIKAFYAPNGDYTRSPGSTLKPLFVYAPAIEENKICTETPILDELTDFGGYCPHNYQDIYYGYQSARECLEKSSNVCAVKILNYVGINRATEYLNKLNIATDEDASLALALGAMKNGVSLSDLATGYSALANKGVFMPSSFISRVEDCDGNVIYQQNKTEKRVFSEETAYLISDMLASTVKNGTAKKLSFNEYHLCGKTGTVGYEDGNTDAYSISYSPDYTVGVWLGNQDCSKMSNRITGGGLPTSFSAKIWEQLYGNNEPNFFSSPVTLKELKLDKITYEEEHVLMLADPIAPERYTLTCKAKSDFSLSEQSERFSKPKVEIDRYSFEDNRFFIKLCRTEFYNYKIYKNGKLVLDTVKCEVDSFSDENLLPNTEYTYSVVPYYFDGKFEYLGNEIILPKIKTPNQSTPDQWWEDD